MQTARGSELTARVALWIAIIGACCSGALLGAWMLTLLEMSVRQVWFNSASLLLNLHMGVWWWRALEREREWRAQCDAIRDMAQEDPRFVLRELRSLRAVPRGKDWLS